MLVRTRDVVHGVTPPHRPALGGLAWRGRRTRCGHRRRSTARDRGSRRINRSGKRPRRGDVDRIEQEGVFAHQPPTAPVEFDQQVDERIIDRAIAGQADHRTPRARIDAHPDRTDRGTVAQVGAPERVCRRDAGAQGLQFLRARGDLDLGAQGLAKTTEHVDLPKACRLQGQRQRCNGEGEQGSPDRF
ncbi:hypothetical protein [Thauera sp.]|uniref:hypothetical protein n=1 Tax=Thauera sp. TaxID=1905334 RepID=UPI002609EC4E|nr:hypothetical protein [Thauera sp.]